MVVQLCMRDFLSGSLVAANVVVFADKSSDMVGSGNGLGTLFQDSQWIVDITQQATLFVDTILLDHGGRQHYSSVLLDVDFYPASLSVGHWCADGIIFP